MGNGDKENGLLVSLAMNMKSPRFENSLACSHPTAVETFTSTEIVA